MTGFSGLLLTSATGASTQCTPSARASMAAARPRASAYLGSPVAPTAMLCGKTVVGWTRKLAPRSKSPATNKGVRANCCRRLVKRARA